MATLIISKGSKLKKQIYASLIIVAIVLSLWTKLIYNDNHVIYTSLFSFLLLIPLWYFESFSNVRIIINKDTVHIVDGTFILNDEYIVPLKDIVKIQIKKYREDTGSAKQSGPITYNHPYDNRTGNSSSYAVKLVLRKRKAIEFGEYIKLNDCKKIKSLINSEINKSA